MEKASLDMGELEELINDRRWKRVRGIRGLGEGLKVVEEQAAAASLASGKGNDQPQKQHEMEAGIGSRVKVAAGISDAEV
eukprot:3011077-Rhodomonas_salina.3